MGVADSELLVVYPSSLSDAVFNVPICGNALRLPMPFEYAVCPSKLFSSSCAVSAILYHWHSSESAGTSDRANSRPCVSSFHFADLNGSDSMPGGLC